MFFDEEQKQFYNLVNVEDAMLDQISDLRFYEGSIYCISPAQEEMIKIRFPKYNFSINATARARAKVSLATIFDLHINKKYELKEQASSVSLSKTGTLMYLGVEGFLKASPKGSDSFYQLESLTPSHINYVTFKEIAQEYLAYSDKETNRFYLLDFTMKQIGRLQAQGVQTLTDELFLLKNYHSSGHDEEIFLWPMGNCKLAIIDIENRQYEVVNELGGVGMTEPLCHCAVSCDNGRRITTLTMKKSTGLTYINFWARGSSVITKPITYIDKGLEALTSLEISTDRSLLFGAGETDEGGALIAFSNDKHFDFVCKEDFLGQPLKIVKKLQNADILIVGAEKTLSIIHYADAHFSILRNFSEIFTDSSLISLDWGGNEIVAIDDKGTTIRHLIFKKQLEEIKVK